MDIYFFDTPRGYDYQFVWVMAPTLQRARLECLYRFGYKPLNPAACVDWWSAQAAWDGLAEHRDGNGLPLPDREVLKMSTKGWRRTRPPRRRILGTGSHTGTPP